MPILTTSATCRSGRTRRTSSSAETDLSTYPTNPNATLQPSDLAHNLTKVDFTKSTLTIGSLPAVDFFNDGSFYLLDSPGHLAGQMTGLARVTVSPDSFVLFAADTAHHIGVTRPRPLLAHNFPCPGDILAASRSAISTDYFWSPNSSLGSFDLSSRASPLLGISDVPGSLYADPAQSQVTIDKQPCCV
uniref:Metallo-beta-lactamase superfamily protein n=1 Tax=Mycena chlorophos TaxID=658473 RepID=A0ABQ0LER1_MYCCL|nr:metallo-beta-lactamase superfamily protein [Mycena chlorophos]